jgi:hypothetical protein
MGIKFIDLDERSIELIRMAAMLLRGRE